MKIANIHARHLRADPPTADSFDGSYDDCVIVVETDAGLTGIGEVDSLSPAIIALINGPSAHRHARCLRDVLVGETLDDPARLWQRMYDATDYIGRRGLVMHAIGGVDIALWDLRGKATGQPIHALLGGAKRKRVPAYGTIYPLERTPTGVRRQIVRAQELHLRHFKLAADPWWLDDVPLTGQLLRAAREQAGADAMLVVDAALAYRTVAEAQRLYPIYRDIGIAFLEAPLPLDDVAGHRELAALGIPVGVGDLGLTHVDEFTGYAAAIWQPDVTMAGGLTGLQRIAERSPRLIPHAYKTNIALAAALHFLAAQERVEPVEFSLSASPLRWELTRERLPVESDGCVRVPSAPGLGVTLNEEFLNRP